MYTCQTFYWHDVSYLATFFAQRASGSGEARHTPTIGGSMQCPTCNVALVMAERSGVEIDYCPKCRGIWLDRGELDKIIERAW